MITTSQKARKLDQTRVQGCLLRCGVQKMQDKMLAEVQGWCRGCRGGAGGAEEVQVVQVVQGGCRLPAPFAPQQA